ncbi:MAG: hypothetical protein AB1645_02795 [Bacillota bacterium]|jgi:hypothetical protein
MCEDRKCSAGEGPPPTHRSDCHRDPCCCGFERKFATRDEKIQRLTRYLEELRAEATAVEERIKALQEG